MSEIAGLSRAQRAYDAMTPRDCGPCPTCAGKAAERAFLECVADLCDGLNVSTDRDRWWHLVKRAAQYVRDDVADGVEEDGGEECRKCSPGRDDD